MTARQLIEQVKKTVPAAQGLVITSVPRGGLQIMQPSNVSESLVKSYADTFHTEDRLTWQTILKRRPMRLEDVWNKRDLESSPYSRDWLEPLGLTHVVAFPLAAPVLEGYPGALHLSRTADQAEFSQGELQKLSDLITHFDERLSTVRANRRGACAGDLPGVERPKVRFAIMDANMRSRNPSGNLADLDVRLREQMIDHARHRLHKLNGDGYSADRILIPDSHGDLWPYRVVTFKRYPALGDGSYNFFCLQPGCNEWGVIRPADFQADAELSRIIPALRFMQQEFQRGPGLIEISQTVKLSPFHFHRRFTELLGLTPKQFLLDCQIHLAKKELLAREKELVDIARECGFAHQSHFTSRFKQATGLTPTRWRRMASERGKSSDNN